MGVIEEPRWKAGPISLYSSLEMKVKGLFLLPSLTCFSLGLAV